MKWLRDLGKDRPLECLLPGMVRPIPGAAKAARAYVLGPPHSRKELRKNLATKKQQEQGDVYHVAGGHGAAAAADPFGLGLANRLADDAFFAAVDLQDKSQEELKNLVGEDLETYQLGLPFDIAHQVPVDHARCGFAADYFNKDDWRRVDNDWLNTAAHIALWMDSSTNNTSLVLAIELLPANKVLMMAADAQVGNWMSWRDVKFEAPYDKVGVDDLLERTVLYKVGHHGSHNATLRRDGLEKMTSDELVAMIPVNRTSVEKKGWKMPFAPMYRDLRQKTQGRVIRADEGIQKKLDDTPAKVWNAFTKAVQESDVCFAYTCRHK